MTPVPAAPIRLREVSGRGDLDAFLALPWCLYCNEPLWVPPLTVVERRRLAPGSPMLVEARLKLFLALQGDVVVGRISVMHEPGRGADDVEAGAWFGHFESVGDPAVVAALLDRAAEEGRRWGAKILRGPRNLSRLEYVGFTVEGFDTLPPVVQGFHPPFYAERMEAEGFDKHHDMIAYEIDIVDEYGQRVPTPPNLADKAAACDLPGLEVRRALWRSMGRDLEAAWKVFDVAYRTVPDTAPLPRGTFKAVGRAYLAFANLELLQIAKVQGRPAGCAACLPEANEALQAARGGWLPAGWLRVALATGLVRTASFKLIGVLPEYLGSGLHAVLVSNIIDGARRAGYTRIEASVIHEDNKPMRAVVEDAGMKPYRRYRVYERSQ